MSSFAHCANSAEYPSTGPSQQSFGLPGKLYKGYQFVGAKNPDWDGSFHDRKEADLLDPVTRRFSEIFCSDLKEYKPVTVQTRGTKGGAVVFDVGSPSGKSFCGIPRWNVHSSGGSEQALMPVSAGSGMMLLDNIVEREGASYSFFDPSGEPSRQSEVNAWKDKGREVSLFEADITVMDTWNDGTDEATGKPDEDGIRREWRLDCEQGCAERTARSLAAKKPKYPSMTGQTDLSRQSKKRVRFGA